LRGEQKPAEPLYHGAVSLYRLAKGARGPRGKLHVEPLGSLKRQDKLQHVTLLPGSGGRELLAAFEQRVERWRLRLPVAELKRLTDADVTVAASFEHPHLAGLHTIEPMTLERADRAVVSAAAADAILLLDPATGAVERTLRLPAALYGEGYPLTPDMDLRRHYIPDHRQATHVNAASPDREGRRVVVSTLIQGAIGVFDLRRGGYEEVTRGFVGCHGARFNAAGEIYFADSTAGALVVLAADGRIARRFGVGSRWLHDVQQIAGPLYAFALADKNELRVYDVEKDELLYREAFLTLPDDDLDAAWRDPGFLGNSTQALSYRAV